MQNQKSPIELAVGMMQKVEDEESGAYKPVYEALKKLDAQYPNVGANLDRLDLGHESLEFAYANLLFSAHAASCYPTPPFATRKEALIALRLFNSVPHGRMTVMNLLYELFPQAVVCVEHVYFLQRQIRRAFTLPDSERPAILRGAKLEEWAYPEEAVDTLRTETIELWKQIGEETHNADEARK